MNQIIQTTSSAANPLPLPLPAPRVPVTVRLAVMSDLPFIDGLQKAHTKQVGWMPTAQFEGKIKLGHVLIAEEGRGFRVQGSGEPANPSLNPEPRTLNPLGYCIGNDQYFKRDDLGIIYQLNVAPGKRRHLVGATLLKAMFEKSAWGCKLFCCWCAQDIDANHFWEACGFTPLAFRTGSRTKGKNAAGKVGPRVHIFWQKRIREGDVTTPWWFPSQTSGGSIREDRLVLPIPPRTHWSEAKPVILPGAEKMQLIEDARQTVKKPRAAREMQVNPARPTVGSGFMSFAAPESKTASKPKREKQPQPKREKQKNNPEHIAAARELRDRYLDRINTVEGLLSVGKYEIAKRVEARKPELAIATSTKELPLAA